MSDREILQRAKRDLKALETDNTLWNPGSLEGAVMISDGFFPFRDGVDVGLHAGVTAVAQPGGSMRDWESIQACNEFSAAMVFTGERSFRH